MKGLTLSGKDVQKVVEDRRRRRMVVVGKIKKRGCLRPFIDEISKSRSGARFLEPRPRGLVLVDSIAPTHRKKMDMSGSEGG